MISETPSNNSIGIKKLSDADLGLSATSNQTHIGLFAETLEFIDSNHVVVSSQLIYSDRSTELLAFFDNIKNPDGTFRSPKIRKGKEEELNVNGQYMNSIVREIRSIVEKERHYDYEVLQAEWYLLWFGRDTKELVFFLFNNLADEMNEVENLIGSIDSKKIITEGNSSFNDLISYLNSKFEDLNRSYFIDLEQSALSGKDKVSTRVVKVPGDFEKGRKRLKETGEKGERILNKYFEIEKSEKRIKDFTWVNDGNIESGKPYDFEIIQTNNEILYVDAKSTGFDEFNKPIYISPNELEWIDTNRDNYHIYRLYSIYAEPKMRICNNVFEVSDIFLPHYKEIRTFLKKVHKELAVSGAKLRVPVDIDVLSFTDNLNLPN